MEQTYFRKGFGLKREIEGDLAKDYHSRLVDRIREGGHSLEVDELTFRLAKEFGFCYGVDRAVEYAYESRTKFPDTSDPTRMGSSIFPGCSPRTWC
jgi:4-hydroxy-3-methylbut-2-enyl diphosphate reductase